MTERQGLYDPAYEHDACGIGFVAHIHGVRSRDVVEKSLEVLHNLTHRSAIAADGCTGDGAGILLQVPHAFLRRVCGPIGISLPDAGSYGVGMLFLPSRRADRLICEHMIEAAVADEGCTVLGWRDVPVDESVLSAPTRRARPAVRQLFVARMGVGREVDTNSSFEISLYVIRRRIEAALSEIPGSECYLASFSSRTMVYKGMLRPDQLAQFYTDLREPDLASAIAMVHSRFSTNTFPSWRLAHPYRFLCHNGEINTVRGNVNWMAARRQAMTSDLLGPDLAKMVPLIGPGQSDTACIDNALELLVIGGGYSLAHAMMMLIPEAWAGNPLMDPQRRAFYEYHAALMEPWDGPAAIAFTDGRQIGATLDRNGLRPARYIITDDDHVIMASESGVLPVPEENIVRKWRLQPGKMLLIDLEQGRIIEDEEIKRTLAEALPYEEWLKDTQYKLEELPEP